MNWYDAGKLMAMASYGDYNVNIEDRFFVGNDLRHFKLDFKLDTFKEQCDFELVTTT